MENERIEALEKRIAQLEAKIAEKDIPALPWPAEVLQEPVSRGGNHIGEQYHRAMCWTDVRKELIKRWPKAQSLAMKFNQFYRVPLSEGQSISSSLEAQAADMERQRQIRYWSERPEEAAQAIIERCRALVMAQVKEDEREKSIQLRIQVREAAKAASSDPSSAAILEALNLSNEQSELFLPRTYGQGHAERLSLDDLSPPCTETEAEAETETTNHVQACAPERRIRSRGFREQTWEDLCYAAGLNAVEDPATAYQAAEIMADIGVTSTIEQGCNAFNRMTKRTDHA